MQLDWESLLRLGSAAVPVVLALAGFIYKRVERLEGALQELRIEVARDYVSREQLEKEMDKVLRAIDRISEKLDRIGQ